MSEMIRCNLSKNFFKGIYSLEILLLLLTG
jgi:hypothetical protein